MPRIRIVPAAVLTAGALLLTGCSSSDSGSSSGSGSGPAAPVGSTSSSPSASPAPTDANAFVTSSFAAFKAVDTVHVAGTFVGAGDNGETLQVDIHYGQDVAIGTLTVSGQQVGISKVADGSTYVKAGADFYRSVGAPEAAIASIADKYVAVTSGTAGFSDFIQLLDKDAFAEQLKPDSTLTSEKVTGPTDVDGVSCYGIEDTDGAFYARAEGEPVPVQLKSKGDGQIDFDQYGDAVDVPTPDPTDVVQVPAS